jgi:glycosyltransferase involved in cell wall biosynthesis
LHRASTFSSARVAISHEWLTIPGGSEKVVMALLELFPQAEIFTSVYDPEPWPPLITERPVHTSFLDRIPRAHSIYPKLLPLMNRAFESFDLTGFDLVLSSNHSCAKNVIAPPGALHVCYCHTPMRHAWEPRFLEGETGRMPRFLLNPLLARLRRQDLAASTRPDHYVANSRHVAERIARFYGRDARVIHPPVEVDPLLAMPRTDGDYYLYLGRVIPYKRADLAVAACERLGRRLVVVGAGRAAGRLREIAGPGTEFRGHVSDDELRALLAGARGLLFPGEEDFGIVPVEAQAAGVPVVAYAVGGAQDSVVHGETGVLFEDQSVEGLVRAIEELEATSLAEARIRDNARRFSPERFAREFMAFLEEVAGG